MPAPESNRKLHTVITTVIPASSKQISSAPGDGTKSGAVGDPVVLRKLRMRWLDEYRDVFPSASALLGVLLFWIVGTFGGLEILNGFRSPLTQLIGLYLMLILVIASAAVAYWGVRELRRRLALRRSADP